MNSKVLMKRLLTAALVSALMATSLVGCGGSKEEPKSNDTAQEQSTEEEKVVADDVGKEEGEHSYESKEKKDAETKDAAKEDKDFAAWEGDWNNMGAYLDDPGVQDAFKKLAEKDGTTPEEAKAKYVEKRKTDFNAMSFEGNTITLYDNFKDKDGKEINKAEYKYVGQEVTKSDNHDLTWEIYEATGDAKYKYFLLMAPHGDEGLKHFHFRYGNEDPKELLAKDGWFPTMVGTDTTPEQISEEIAE